MFSSDDEQDDRGIFDQLKSIKPFTIDQLYLLHPDVGCPPKSSIARGDDGCEDQLELAPSDREIYQYLVEHEQLRNQLIELRHDIKKLFKNTYHNIDNAWTLKDESTRKIAMCQQGKIAETTFKYKQAHIDKKHLDKFLQGFSELIELITKDYIYYSFETQTKRNRIATHLSISYQTPDVELRKLKLKSAIVTLIKFICYLGDIKSDFVIQCRKWLRALAKRFLESGTTEDHRFIISQLARGPVGTADWSADLVECKPYEQVCGFDSVPQYITHCSTLLSELFYSLQMRIRYVAATSVFHSKSGDNDEKGGPSNSGLPSEQNWSLVDPRFSCTEELNISSSCNNLLSESDIIKFCLRIPVAQIFRAYVKKCLDSSDEFHLETDKNYEFIMLKLLTIGTIIIKTYQIGLDTFNSIQYGSLIEYLSSQIRRTVIILSDQWAEFKNRLKGIDDALLMRLQVEYDSFMLRSILIILELRGSGIWRHLSRVEQEEPDIHNNDGNLHAWATDSLRPAFTKLLRVTGISSIQQQDKTSAVVTPEQVTELIPNQKEASKVSRLTSSSLTYEFSIEWFKEVSESMLWHILWQFYHSGFVSSCDYHSDDYWVAKFQEKSVVYLFVNKIRDSPPGECSYLINSITSMLLSRTRHESKLVNFIATEIFNLTFRHQAVKDKVTKKGLSSLIRCAEKFPNLISLYIHLMCEQQESSNETTLDETATDLIRGCSLNGWLCDEDEFMTLENWLIEYPLESAQNKMARLILSKILLNSPRERPKQQQQETPPDNDSFTSETTTHSRPSRYRPRGGGGGGGGGSGSLRGRNQGSTKRKCCFVDLNLRRKIALLLYNTSIRHFPENTEFGAQSLGASVEVALGTGLYCEQAESKQDDLSALAIETNYSQFYIWSWRMLFSLRLHILNQPETDWNDVQSRSGTSRSIKNTVLINDSFHPVPSIEDTECSRLAEGLKKQNPMASFIYLILTDVTWQVDNLETCIVHLNILANSGHITPSLMVMKYVTICHLNDLTEVLTKDKKCIEYFTTIILSNFDTTRLASLIATQLNHLKQYRQLQLSHFYVGVLLEVNQVISKRNASSWFSNNEISFERSACLLDFIVRFNFATQRFEIVRKFYDCAYVIQDNLASQSNGWLGSLLTSNSDQRDILTNLHMLTQKFKKYAWLQWVTTECDTLRLEKIWEDIVVYLSGNEEANLDLAIKKVCSNVNVGSLKSTLPIYAWIRQIFAIMEQDPNHPLYPLIWYNFFLNYFSNSLNAASVGYKLVSPPTITKLMSTLDELYNYHLFKQRNWSSSPSVMQQNSLTQLYKAYKLWLQDVSLREAYIDIDRLKDDYLVPLLKAVMESSNAGVCLQFIDLQSIETQNKNLMQIWLASTDLLQSHNNFMNESIVYLDAHNQSSALTKDDSLLDTTNCDDSMVNDAIALLASPFGAAAVAASSSASDIPTSKSLDNAHEELCKPVNEDYIGEQKYQSTEELMEVVKRNFTLVFEESNVFGLNVSELDSTKSEILELVRHLYSNEKREFLRVVACADGHECAGPARIKLEAEEALLDERKSQCIQDRRRQCQELVGELLLMPKNRTVSSTVIIEEKIRRLIGEPGRSQMVIESLLSWLSEPINYNQLKGSYYAANHLLKTTLEILSTSDQIDAYNTKLIDVCLAHPESIQIFSPYLSPSACSDQVFLSLYQTICSKQAILGSNATFVLLTKFDLNTYLNRSGQVAPKSKQNLHDLIGSTCRALKDIGKDPEELTMDLFKQHLQVELAPPDRRKASELLLVLSHFLEAMSEQSLAPSLWLYYLTFIGLERNTTNKSRGNLLSGKSTTSAASLSPRRDSSQTIVSGDGGIAVAMKPTTYHQDLLAADPIGASLNWIAEDVARLADCQSVFDYHSLNNLIKTICDFMKQQHAKNSTMTLLELYQDYLEQYGLLMLSVTFMWLKTTSELYPDNHELIWKQFMDLWYDWIFLTKNCQNVGKTSYSLVVSFFVTSLQYMLHRIPESTGSILQSLLLELTNYVAQTREIVYLELTILQRCLKNLPWNNILFTPGDVDNLACLSEQENYNVSELVSHIMLQVNTQDSLARINELNPGIVGHVAERLATIIILQSNHLKGFKLYGNYFRSIRVEDIPRLASLALARTEFINLEHNHNNKLLIKLMRCICIDNNTANHKQPQQQQQQQQLHHHRHQQQPLSERFERALNYARFVSNYLIDLIKRHPTVTQSHSKAYLDTIIYGTLNDLDSMLTAPELDLTHKTMLYASLLEFCNCDTLDIEARQLLALSLMSSSLFRNKPKLMVDLVLAVSQFLKEPKVLVQMIETLIESYERAIGSSQQNDVKIWSQFHLRSIPEDVYLNCCIEEHAPLALVIHFESLFCANKELLEVGEQLPTDLRQIWLKFFHWLAKLTQTLGSAAAAAAAPRGAQIHECAKLASTWLQVLVDLELYLKQFLVNHMEESLLPADAANVDEQQNGQTTTTTSNNKPILSDEHKLLIDYIKQLIAFYDTINSGGLWSYIKSSSATRSNQLCKISIASLANACFLADRTLVVVRSLDLNNESNDHQSQSSTLAPHLVALRDELAKLRRSCLTKLESARKSKNMLDSVQFIETLIGSVQQNDKVQYSEGVQLIRTYVRANCLTLNAVEVATT